MLGRSVVMEDPVGRLIAGSGHAEEDQLRAKIEERALRASKGSGFDEAVGSGGTVTPGYPMGTCPCPSSAGVLLTANCSGPPSALAPRLGTSGSSWKAATSGPKTWCSFTGPGASSRPNSGKERIRLETELGVRGDFVDDLVSGHYGSVELLLQRARYLGADLAEGALVMVVDIDDFARYIARRRPKEPAIQELKRRLADAVRLQTRQLFSNSLLGPRSDNVILFLGCAEGEDPEELPEKAQLLAKGVQRYVKGLLPDLTVSVGIGGYKKDPAQLPDAYSEAGVALEIGHLIHGPSERLDLREDRNI